LASDCLLFGALISTYVLYRGASTTGPYPADVFDIPYTSVSSFVLLASSLTMVLALSAIQRGDVGRCRGWLLAAALLGVAFLGGEVGGVAWVGHGSGCSRRRCSRSRSSAGRSTSSRRSSTRDSRSRPTCSGRRSTC